MVPGKFFNGGKWWDQGRCWWSVFVMSVRLWSVRCISRGWGHPWAPQVFSEHSLDFEWRGWMWIWYRIGRSRVAVAFLLSYVGLGCGVLWLFFAFREFPAISEHTGRSRNTFWILNGMVGRRFGIVLAAHRTGVVFGCYGSAVGREF